ANGLAIHGLLTRSALWCTVAAELAVRTDAECAQFEATLLWDPDLELYELYPFVHTLTLRMSLNAHGLSISTRVQNTGTGDLPISFGWHPYFAFAAESSGLSIPARRTYVLDQRLLPTGQMRGAEEYFSIPPAAAGQPYRV